jgi:hypothetical protein
MRLLPLAVIVLLLSARDAHALQCAERTLEEDVARATDVLTGKVVASDRKRGRAEVLVGKVYKGKASGTIVMQIGWNPAPPKNAEVLLLGRRDGQVIEVSPCGGLLDSQRAGAALARLDGGLADRIGATLPATPAAALGALCTALGAEAPLGPLTIAGAEPELWQVGRVDAAGQQLDPAAARAALRSLRSTAGAGCDTLAMRLGPTIPEQLATLAPGWYAFDGGDFLRLSYVASATRVLSFSWHRFDRFLALDDIVAWQRP